MKSIIKIEQLIQIQYTIISVTVRSTLGSNDFSQLKYLKIKYPRMLVLIPNNNFKKWPGI